MSSCFMCNQKNFKQRLGHTTWKLISLIIEGYPFKPDLYEKNHMNNFIYELAHIYPCHECRPGFIEYVNKNPPKVDNKEDLYKYFMLLRKNINKTNNNMFVDLISTQNDFIYKK